MRLLDTSVVVTMLTLEPRSHAIAEWIAAHAGELCVSAWLEPELSAALAAKQRMGEIDARARLSSLRLFNDMQDVVFIVADIERTDFEEAARMCDDPGLGLRAPDALQLSVALRLKLNLATLDRKQARAAELLGIGVITL